MTRKHFIALAEALKFAHPGLSGHDTPEARQTWKELVESVADVCGGTNSRFNRGRFCDATVPAGREGDLEHYPQ